MRDESYEMFDCFDGQRHFGEAVVYVRHSSSPEKKVEKYSHVFGHGLGFGLDRQDALECFRQCYQEHVNGQAVPGMSMEGRMQSIAAARLSGLERSHFSWSSEGDTANNATEAGNNDAEAADGDEEAADSDNGVSLGDIQEHATSHDRTPERHSTTHDQPSGIKTA